MLLWFIVIFYEIFFNNAQIPKECATNFTLKTGICCPLSKLTRQVCGFPERGDCSSVLIYEKKVEMFGFEDTRFQWPKQWFGNLCKCKGNYFGPSCDDCWYGWKGENCSERHIVVRRNIMGYNKKEKEQFVKVMKLLRKEESSYLLVKEAYRDMDESVVPCNIYEMVVNIHFFAQRSIITKNAGLCEDTPHFDFAHANVGFLTFHRNLMLVWEKWSAEVAKRKLGIDNFTFPYWDWTDQKKCEICTDDLIGAQGRRSEDGSYYLSEKSPFHSWTVYCDLFSPKSEYPINNCAPCSSSSQSSLLTRKVVSSFPPLKHVNFTLSRTLYANTHIASNILTRCPTFTKALEGVCGGDNWNVKHTMHDAVHSNVVGPFSESSTSPNDPLFIFHHTQIDRLFQAWWISNNASSKIYPKSSTPGHCFLCNQVGFIPIVAHKQFFRDSRELGYDYESLKFGKG